MKRSLSYLLIAVAAVGATLAGYYTSTALRDTPANDAADLSPAAAETLLAITLPDVDGQSYVLSDWRGKVLVINFWATWCPPCTKEIPEFSAVSRRHADDPVQFVGISIDTAENVREFNARFDVPYPLLIGSSETLGLATQVGNTARALPFTVIIGMDGRIANVTLGTLDEAQLEGKIRSLLPS